MATNIFSQGAPSGIFSENLKKSKLAILEIRTFDSKPTVYFFGYSLTPQIDHVQNHGTFLWTVISENIRE